MAFLRRRQPVHRADPTSPTGRAAGTSRTSAAGAPGGPAAPPRPPVDIGAATATGRRAENQDRYAVGPAWAVVSDGVGGHAGGARAAQLTVDAVAAALAPLPWPPTAGTAEPYPGDGRVGRGEEGRGGPRGAVGGALAAGAREANAGVRAGRTGDPSVGTMGATLTAAAATALGSGGSRWLLASVGDSPAWLVTPAGLARITDDHTVAAALVRSGVISPGDAATHPGRHVLVQAVGTEDRIAPDIVAVDLAPGDALVLASDGVSDVLDDAAVAAAVADPTAAAAGGGDAEAAARRLVTAALAAGSTDNVTAVVVRHLARSTGDDAAG